MGKLIVDAEWLVKQSYTRIGGCKGCMLLDSGDCDQNKQQIDDCLALMLERSKGNIHPLTPEMENAGEMVELLKEAYRELTKDEYPLTAYLIESLLDAITRRTNLHRERGR